MKLNQAIEAVSTDPRVKVVRKIWTWYVRSNGRSIGEFSSKEDAFMAAAKHLNKLKR